MLIYVAHPYGGGEKNKEKVEEIIKKLYKTYSVKYHTFISPIHAFGYLYDLVTYDEGMAMCKGLLKCCDYLLLCDGWEDSRGCRIEKEFATLIEMGFDDVSEWLGGGLEDE